MKVPHSLTINLDLPDLAVRMDEACNALNMEVNDILYALEEFEREEQPLEPLHGCSQDTEIMEEVEALFRETELLREGDAAVAMSREKELGNNKAIRNHAKQLKTAQRRTACAMDLQATLHLTRQNLMENYVFPSSSECIQAEKTTPPQRRVHHRLSMNDSVSGVVITKAILAIGQSHIFDHAIVR